ncbi:hypothetical protein FHG87_012746 [Trinorchestia longiramus]|nr:hypothetical protein FHG87_012746 [Trinorchestia longiramus]
MSTHNYFLLLLPPLSPAPPLPPAPLLSPAPLILPPVLLHRQRLLPASTSLTNTCHSLDFRRNTTLNRVPRGRQSTSRKTANLSRNTAPRNLKSIQSKNPALSCFSGILNVFDIITSIFVLLLFNPSLFVAPFTPTSARSASHHHPPAPVTFTPNKDYNPTQSATWQLLQESEVPPSLEKLGAHPDMNEHDPIYSEVYAAPKAQTSALRPGKLGFKGGSPSPQIGASMLSPQRVDSQQAPGTPPPQGAVTPVAAAALAEPSVNRGRSPRNEPIPLYETNSIGGRRRIAQSSSFNKLMQNMLME